MPTYLRCTLLLLISLAVSGCTGAATLPKVNGWLSPSLAKSEVDALRQLVAEGDLTGDELLLCTPDNTEPNCEDGERPRAIIEEGHLRQLTLSDQGLSSVEPVSSLEKIESLDLSGNELTALTLESLPELRDLDLASNNLQSLTLRHLDRLAELDIEGNERLERLHLSDLGRLKELTLERSRLTELTLRALPSLERLVVSKSDLEQADLPFDELPKLRHLNLSGNQLTELALPDVSSLEILKVNDNRLTRLDLSALTALRKLEANDNRLAEVQWGPTAGYVEVRLDGNNLTALDMEAFDGLKHLSVADNALETLEMETAPSLKSLNVAGNPVDRLDIGTEQTLKALDVSRTNLSSFEKLPAIEARQVKAAGTGISSWNGVTEFVAQSGVERLDMSNNKLTGELDLEWLMTIHTENDTPTLRALDLSGNRLEQVSDFEYLCTLDELDLSDNEIERLEDVTVVKGLDELPDYPNCGYRRGRKIVYGEPTVDLRGNRFDRLADLDLDTDETGALEGIGSLTNSYNILLAPTVDLKLDDNPLPGTAVGKLTDLRGEYEEEADGLRLRPTRIHRGNPASDLPSVGESVVGGGTEGSIGRGRSPRRRRGGGFRGGK